MIDTFIECSDLTKYYRTPPSLNMVLKNANGVLLGNKPVTITIHGVTYNRTTNGRGGASLDINLAPGVYTAVVEFAGDTQYNASSKTVTVTVRSRYFSVDAPYLVKDYGGAEALIITISEVYTSTPVVGKEFSITINGVTYNRTTDSKGQGKLNINLMPGVYSYTVNVPSDEGSSAVTLTSTVKVMASTFMDGIDIVKMDDETVVYQCAVYDPFSRLLDVTVTLTVNGVSYVRSSEADGLVKLNIRLGAGEYTIKAEYPGDNLHHASSVQNRIVSKARKQYLTTVRNGLSIPGNNRGFMESHIYIGVWGIEYSSQNNIKALHPLLNDMSAWEDITFTNYEITETDPRVKTAKFTTDTYLDLTRGRHWVYITSPYHEGFGGMVLKVDFDKSTGLYTYQCQDGRRQYLSQRRFISLDNNHTVYDALEFFLFSPFNSSNFPVTNEEKNGVVAKRLLSGLHPIGDYDNLKSGAAKFTNKFKEPLGEMLGFDSFINYIMNYSHVGGFPTDVYFTPDGICHIDPIDLDAWMKTGFVLTHSDLASYKYGFDITNIITTVKVKDNWKGASAPVYADTINLWWYVGRQEVMIDPVTTTTTTSSGSSSSGSSSGGSTTSGKGKTVVVGCDSNTNADSTFQNATINKLRGAGYNVERLSIGPGPFANYDWHGASKGKVGVFIMAPSIVAIADAMSHKGFDKLVFGLRGDFEKGRRGAVEPGFSTNPWRPDNDCTSVCNKYSGKTGKQIDEMIRPRGCLVGDTTAEGLANRILAAVNGDNGGVAGSSSTSTNTSTNTTQTTTTIVDEVATYQKALDKMSESVRSLLSFEIKLPLNHTMFKELHTNQFLWTQLPPEFKLVNLEKIFKILPSYKVNRGVSYVENRWYVEKIVTKMDSNGLFATITLNPFPSSYSVYSNAVKGYIDAYNQAFKQQNNNTSGTSTSTGTGQARLGKDSTDTNSMACKRGGSYGDAGTGGNYDSCAQKGYAQQGRKYYEWARKYNDPISLAKALAKRFSYEGYSGNHDANAEVTHNNGGTIHCNCYDACRLVKCCFDAAGLDCIVVTGSIYEGGHGWNSVKYNGKWYSFDLCYAVRAGTDQKGTNALRKFF